MTSCNRNFSPADADERDKLKRHCTYLRHKRQRTIIAIKAAKRRVDAAPECDEFLEYELKRWEMKCEAIEGELRNAEALLEEMEGA